ncbi:MAG: tetratricopeptide repeat protein, partial [Chitinivibrionales bacterium]|nr:tetratricopeptide repeat protein [Chitinivibrionales bacterium]
ADSAGGVSKLDSLDAWYNQAVTLQGDSKTGTAESLYVRILREDSSYTFALNNLGAIYAARGELDSAIQYYTRALDKKHDMPEAYANLVRVYIARKEFAQARRWLVKGQGHNPDSQLLKEIQKTVGDSARVYERKK